MARTAEVYSNSDWTQDGALPLFASQFAALVDLRRDMQPLPLMPQRQPGAGEQYRFHFDMTKCIGCKCCVVACNEQNGNPAGIHWRRVGEVEGGHYPFVKRQHLSMGCNHCVEPSCLIGCPVEAYHKDPITGVVLHSADACIGCQYCTWNCSYGVPQYNPERGVVGKCDLCHNRLADEMAPACVQACPEGAIAVEIVDVANWRRDYLSANAPGLPSAGDSISTTRVTLPRDLPPDTGRVDMERVAPEHPHWPLVFMLVLAQLSVGAFVVLAAMELFGATVRATTGLAAFALAAISLATATLHLGRPIYAWRALKGLRRSWLSREVLALTIFAGCSAIYAAAALFASSWRMPAGCAAALAGCAGVVCSARIYMVPARPAWASRFTVAEFVATSCVLGPMFVRVLEPGHRWLTLLPVLGAAWQLVAQVGKLLWLSRSQIFELRASALLLAGRLRTAFVLRLAILVAAGIVLPLEAESSRTLAALFGLALSGEWIGRWLFFVSVVPKNMAAAFTRRERAA